MQRSRKRSNKNNVNARSANNAKSLLAIDPAYKGPIQLRSVSQQTYVEKMNVTLQTNATTNVSGVMDLVFGNSPASLSQWTTLAGLYNEYRVLGMKLEFTPIKQVSTWAYGISYTVIDHDVSAALGGAAAAAQHESYMQLGNYSRWSREARSNGIEEFDFISTASPAAQYYIKVYSSANTPSITIGVFALTYLIEFRGKK